LNKWEKSSDIQKRKFQFSTSFFNPDWDDEKNMESVWEMCFTNYHGHNYELIVKIIGEPDGKLVM
jgi:6-pyruvoyltetrahydropterin/6-carboxytetrahydropterin synthase